MKQFILIVHVQSLTDAELPEDQVENILDIHPAGDPPQSPAGQSELLRLQLDRTDLQPPAQSLAAILQRLRCRSRVRTG